MNFRPRLKKDCTPFELQTPHRSPFCLVLDLSPLYCRDKSPALDVFFRPGNAYLLFHTCIQLTLLQQTIVCVHIPIPPQTRFSSGSPQRLTYHFSALFPPKVYFLLPSLIKLIFSSPPLSFQPRRPALFKVVAFPTTSSFFRSIAFLKNRYPVTDP